MTKNTQMIRDALGSPIPQMLNVDGSYTVLANGETTGIDFSKHELLRDKLGSPIPYQYFNVSEMRFVEGVLGGSGVPGEEVTQLIQDVEQIKSDMYIEQTVVRDIDTRLDNTIEQGFYGRSQGNLVVESAWSHFRVDNPSNRKFRLANNVGGTVRLVLLRAIGSTISNRVLNVNEVFEIPSGVNFISINIQRPGVGSGTANRELTVFDDVSGFSVNEVVTTPITTATHIKSKIEEVENDLNKNKIMKILMVGNSFSLDALQFLDNISRSAGVELVVGIAYDSNGSLSGLATKIQNGTAMDSYHKWIDGDYTTITGRTLGSIVTEENWDVITYQQLSLESGNYSSFQPPLNDIHNYVRGLATNTNVKFGLHMTWAYATGSTNLANTSYSTQSAMFEAIATTYTQVLRDMDFDILIPNGTTIQNARTSADLRAIGTDLTRDGAHLNMGVGRYLAALTVFETLVAPYYKKDLFSDVTYYPTNDGATRFTAYLSKKAVKNAVLNPFRITTL